MVHSVKLFVEKNFIFSCFKEYVDRNVTLTKSVAKIRESLECNH